MKNLLQLLVLTLALFIGIDNLKAIPNLQDPLIDQIFPAVFTQGDTANVTIIAHNTHFKQGMTQVKIYCPTCLSYRFPLSVSVINDTTLIAKFCLYYAWEADVYNMGVETVGEGVLWKNASFTILAGPYPPSFSITPNTGTQGQIVNIAVKGTNTHFLQGKVGKNGFALYSIAPGSKSINCSDVDYINDTMLDVTFNFDYKCQPGIYDFGISGFDGAPPLILSQCFTITTGPLVPKLNPLPVTSAPQGSELTLHISGMNTHFLSGLYKLSIGDYQPYTMNVINDSTVDVIFKFTYDMNPGVYPFTISNPIDGPLTLANAFTILKGGNQPVISNISPLLATQGQIIMLNITGKNTHFNSLSTRVLLQQNVKQLLPDTTVIVNDTLMKAQFTFSKSEFLGYYDVIVPASVSVSEPEMRLSKAFKLYPLGANIVFISPSSSVKGDTLQITVKAINTHFLSGTNVMQLKSIYGGIPVEGYNITALSDSSLTGTFNFTDMNFNGKYTMTISNVMDGTIKMDSAFMLHPQPGEPDIEGINPRSAIYGMQLTLTIHGKNTHFESDLDSIKFHNWFQNIYPLSLNIHNDTTITAIFKMPSYSSSGASGSSFFDLAIFSNQPIALLNAFELTVPVGISKIDKQIQILIYPNPSSGIFNMIMPDELKINQLEVSNLIGEILYRQSYVNDFFKLDISDFAPGIYNLKLISSDVMRNIKLIKE